MTAYIATIRTKSSYSKNHLWRNGSILFLIGLILLSVCDTNELLQYLCDLVEDGVDMFPDFFRNFIALFVKRDIFGGHNVVQTRDGRREIWEWRLQWLRKSGRLSLQFLKLLKHGVGQIVDENLGVCQGRLCQVGNGLRIFFRTLPSRYRRQFSRVIRLR